MDSCWASLSGKLPFWDHPDPAAVQQCATGIQRPSFHTSILRQFLVYYSPARAGAGGLPARRGGPRPPGPAQRRGPLAAGSCPRLPVKERGAARKRVSLAALQAWAPWGGQRRSSARIQNERVSSLRPQTPCGAGRRDPAPAGRQAQRIESLPSPPKASSAVGKPCPNGVSRSSYGRPRRGTRGGRFPPSLADEVRP